MPDIRRPPPRLLVVDDEDLVQRAIERLLRDDYVVVGAGSGAEALQRIRDGGGFDAVLCDVMMPGMTGLELHETLLREAPDMARRTVFMTGGVLTSEQRAAFERLSNPKLAKPFDVPTLVKTIELVLTPAPGFDRTQG